MAVEIFRNIFKKDKPGFGVDPNLQLYYKFVRQHDPDLGKRVRVEAKKKEKRFDRIGVACFFYDKNGRLLTIREKTPRKENGRLCGHLGVPCETRQDGETTWHNLARLFTEELNLKEADYENFQKSIKSFKINNLIGVELVTDIGPQKIGVYPVKVVVSDTRLFDLIISENNEVDIEGWHFPDEIYKNENVRPLVKQVIAHEYKNTI